MTDQGQGTVKGRARRRFPWLTLGLWVLLAFLLAGVGFAVVPACGLSLPGLRPFLLFCPAAAEIQTEDPALDAERQREQALRQRLDRMRLILVGAPDCPQPEPPPIQIAQAEPEPEPPPPPPPEPEPEPVPEPDPVIVPEPEPEPVIVPEPEPEPDFVPPTPTERPTAPPRPQPPPPPPPPPEPEPQPQPPPPPPSPQDSEYDQRLERAGVQDRNVMVTLIWDNVNDIDLHIICPNGQRISYQAMTGCSGRLDVDANGGGPQTRNPVENISWGTNAPPGTYRVEVHHYANHGAPDPTPYRVRVRIGQEERYYSGILTPNQRTGVTTFTIP